MGHFTIALPDNTVADVRWGRVRKMAIRLPFFKHRSAVNEPETGYIVRVAPDKEYRLFKSKNGRWSKDPEGAVAIDDEPLLSFQKAIAEKETA